MSENFIHATDAIEEDVKVRMRRAVNELREELDLEAELATFAAQRLSPATWEAPVLHLEDITGIPFLQDIAGIEEYQHRARVRAGTGDIFVAVSDPAIGYEDYCRDHLGLGSPHFLQTKAARNNPMAVALACCEGPALDELVKYAEAGGGLAIHPYMAIEAVWEMAACIARKTSAPVEIIGPPPPILWLANDKSHLSHLVSRSLGEEYVVETRRASSAREISEDLLDLAAHHELVGIKRTRCASAMGNIVFDAAFLRGLPPGEALALVQAFLHRTEWVEGEDVLIVEWVKTDLSPSTQLWIPPTGQGNVLLQGIYEQLLSGPEKVFVGSRPSTLPAPVNAELAGASMVVGEALQALGYVGRCSFDFIVCGDIHGDFQIKFTECNGRWGGTSTPMHLVDRLIKSPRPAYVAKDYFLPESHVGMSFVEFLKLVDSELFDPATGKGRFIVYNVGPYQSKGKLDIIGLGESPEDARVGLDEILPEMLGI
ncbi:MAG: hypothetical protein ACNA8W_12675 [Bradymonadaceae bacterium]